jgi:hypothetical protein
MSARGSGIRPNESGGDSFRSPPLDVDILTSSSSVVNKVIKVVWDFEKIEKLGGPDSASKKWRCNWCGLTLSGWNATKALSHVTKSPGNNDVK